MIDYKIKHDNNNSPHDESIRRLMKENESWRNRFENLERILSEVSPESEGLSIESRVSQLIGKNFEATSKGTRLKLALKQVREILVPEGGTIVGRAKVLIDHFLWNDKAASEMNSNKVEDVVENDT